MISTSMPAAQRVYTALLDHPDGATPDVLAEACGMARKTARNHLSRLHAAGYVRANGDGIWHALPVLNIPTGPPPSSPDVATVPGMAAVATIPAGDDEDDEDDAAPPAVPAWRGEDAQLARVAAGLDARMRDAIATAMSITSSLAGRDAELLSRAELCTLTEQQAECALAAREAVPSLPRLTTPGLAQPKPPTRRPHFVGRLAYWYAEQDAAAVAVLRGLDALDVALAALPAAAARVAELDDTPYALPLTPRRLRAGQQACKDAALAHSEAQGAVRTNVAGMGQALLRLSDARRQIDAATQDLAKLDALIAEGGHGQRSRTLAPPAKPATWTRMGGTSAGGMS